MTMTIQTMSPGYELTANGTIGVHASAFTTTLRDGNPTPGTIPVTVNMHLSLQDIEAALWVQLHGGWTTEDLADDAEVTELVLSTLLDERGGDLDDARQHLSTVAVTSPDYLLAEWVHQRVAELYDHRVPKSRAS
jgi:hypothetical protein